MGNLHSAFEFFESAFQQLNQHSISGSRSVKILETYCGPGEI